MDFIKKLIPEKLLKVIRPWYHGLLAIIASWYFGKPSSSLIVIGVTGTAGKSTTVQMLARILNYAGKKCGFITTISFFEGQTEQINKHGLSMPGGWLLQKQLKAMLKNGCEYVVVECTSEGLAQNRHLGISFDMAVFTNLSEAHIEVHGGFKNYRRAKGKLFESLTNSQKSLVEKIIVANGDDENAEYFLSFQADRKLAVGSNLKNFDERVEVLSLANINTNDQAFEINGAGFEVKLLGSFNIYNAALAAAAGYALGVPFADSAKAISFFDKIRGRMETVPNNLGATIIVDYACEPATIKAALMAVKALPHSKIIHVLGSTGGHRDKQKRFIFGQTSAEYADEIIITNDDVYDSDPEGIAQNIVSGIKQNATGIKLFEIILDRRQAIYKALKKAQVGDIVFITGKGSEQFLVLPGNKRIEWDEVSVVKEELNKIESGIKN